MRHRIRLLIIGLASLVLVSLLAYWGLQRGDRPGGSDGEGRPAMAYALPDPAGSSHPATEACENCHESDTPDEAKAREMARQVPRLCYRCHENETKTFAHVHGPVAVGQCLFCHDPHKSEHPYLLKQNPVQLCGQCHTQASLATIENHQATSHADCLECHTSHASQERFLLKASQSQSEAELGMGDTNKRP